MPKRYPDKNEQTAAWLGREFDRYLDDTKLYSADGKPTIELKAFMIKVIRCLNIVANADLIQASPYYCFLIQQCLRFNGRLQKGRVPIRHDFIPVQAQSLKVSKKNNIGGTFRDAITVNNNGQPDTYYYKQGDVASYKEEYIANSGKIGLDTQLGNATGFVNKCREKLFNSTNDSNQDYFKGNQQLLHETCQKHFLNAVKNVENGQALSEDEWSVIQGKKGFYQSPQFTQYNHQPKIKHIGHASMLYSVGGFSVVTDPVHYQPGTGWDALGFLKMGAKVCYPRKTSPAFAPKRYPGVSVVWISHNHHDHLCPKSLTEAFSKDTLMIVPRGDGEKLKAWGFKNVVEIDSWQESVVLHDPVLKQTLTIHSLPARHASGRGTTDVMEALYMGCLIEYKDEKGNHSLSVVTGDTAVLDEEHYQQLQDFIVKKAKIPVKALCVASGPDRPRSLMECSHQSTADGLVFHARITIANLLLAKKSQAAKIVELASFDELKQHACRAIAYHQGCYRLGLLSYNDVAITVNRLLAAIHLFSLGDEQMTVSTLRQHLEKNSKQPVDNIYYTVMDQFERDGLLDLLKQYERIRIRGKQNTSRYLKLNELVDIIEASYTIPIVGQTINLTIGKQFASKPLFNPETLLENDVFRYQLQNELKTLLKQEVKSIHPFFSQVQSSMNKLYGNTAKVDILSKLIASNDFKSNCRQYDVATNPQVKLRYVQKLLTQIHQTVQGKGVHDESVRETGAMEMLILLLGNHFMASYEKMLKLNITNDATSDLMKNFVT